MPTPQTVEWKNELPVPKWTDTKDNPASWVEPSIESAVDVPFPGESDIYQDLEAEIEQAKRILELEDNWDGEGSPAYSKDTLNRAVEFLTTLVKGLWESRAIHSPIPMISPGPDGSIDLHWKQQSKELLVNIPADVNEMSAFYGDNYGTQKIRGTLDPRNSTLGIAIWLMDLN